MVTIEKIFPEYLSLDGGTQPRANIDKEVWEEYGERMKAGDKFPPLTVFYDGENHWLVDGFHRYEASVMHLPGIAVECEVHQGTLADAQWYSYAVNREHGLRRTNGDKERAVRAALNHPKSEGMSNCQIAEHVGVSEFLVRKCRPTSVQSKSDETASSSSVDDLTSIKSKSDDPAIGPSPSPLGLTSIKSKSTAPAASVSPSPPDLTSIKSKSNGPAPGVSVAPPDLTSIKSKSDAPPAGPASHLSDLTSIKSKSAAAGETESPAKRPRTGRDGRTINTAKIGRRTRRPRCATEYHQAKQEGRRSRFSSMVTPTLPNNHVRNCAYELLEYLTYDYLMKVFEEIRNLHQKRLEEGRADA